MHKRTLKLWMGIGTFALLGAGADAAELHGKGHADHPPIQVAQDAHQHGAGGEGGEGGEGGQEKDAFSEAPASEALVGRLLMLKGHLSVGKELYAAGRLDDAAPHYLHPAEEIYGLVEGELKKRKLNQFDKDLKALAELVKGKKPAAEVFAKQEAVVAKVDKAIAGADKKAPAFTMGVLPGVLATAADEYKEAFAEGKLVNVVEYQDARGFVTAARGYVSSHARDLSAKDKDAYGKLATNLDAIAKAFPTAVPPQPVVMDAGAVQALVSKVELLKGSFK